MALGGGVWSTQNKVLPGYYVNFTSAGRAAAMLSERGVAAVPFAFNWGPVDTVFSVTSADLQKHCMKFFGYAYDAPEMLPVREVFRNANTLLAYRLANAPTAATNTYATAKYPGTRGNDIRIVIAANVDSPETYDVSTYIGTSLVDMQNVSTASDSWQTITLRLRPKRNLKPRPASPLQAARTVRT